MKGAMRFLVVLLFSLAIVACPCAAARAQAPLDMPIEIVPTIGHSDSVFAVAVSPDGRTALSGSDDKTLRLWDVLTGRLIRTFKGHEGHVFVVAFAPDGLTVLSGATDNTLKLWDVTSGRVIRSFEGDFEAGALAPDGRTVLSGGTDGTLKLWNAASGRLMRTFAGHADYVDAVAFSPDGRTVISGSGDNTLKLWDVADGRLIRTFQGHTDRVTSVGFAPDGRTVLSGSWDKTLKLWDVATGTVIRTFEGQTDSVPVGRFAPDGRTAIIWDPESEPGLVDVATGKLIKRLKGHERGTGGAFTPDGRTVLTANRRSLNLWNAASGENVRTFKGDLTFIDVVAFSPDGRTILGDGGAALWDTASGRLIRTFEGAISDLTFVAGAPNGRWILLSDKNDKLQLWDVAQGKAVRAFDRATFKPAYSGQRNYVHAGAFTPDSRRVVSAYEDETVKLWDAGGGREIKAFKGHRNAVVAVAASPDGRTALSGSYDDTLKLWDLAGGRLLRTFAGHQGVVRAVAFAPDGRTALSGSGDKTVKLWDVKTGKTIRTFSGHGDEVRSIVVAADGRTALSGSTDRKVKLWDLATGKLIRTFEAQTGPIVSVAVEADGQRVAATDDSGTVTLWRATTGEVMATLVMGSTGEWLTMTPEGFFNASEQGASLLSVVRGRSLYSIDQFYQTMHRPDLVREKLAGDPDGKVREAAAKLDLAKIIAGGAAPSVTIASPADGSSVANGNVTLDAAIVDQGGGIGKVEWRVNGTTLGVEERGLFLRDLHASRTLSLEPGDNILEVTAFNRQGLIASRPARIRVTRTGGEAARPRLFVLAIGINDYFDSRLQLSFAATDAKSLSDALHRAGRTLYDEVDVTTVLDADATANHLDKVFEDLAGKVRPQDVFVFFLAGHGKTVDARYYFIPQDFRYAGEDSIVRRAIGQDRWQSWFARIPARKSLLLFDTCESGSLTGDRVAQRGLERVVALDRMTQAMGRTVLTASTDDAPALEGYRGHGVFTYALLDSFGHAEVHPDGAVYVTDLASFIDREVPDVSYRVFKQRQIPQMKIVGSNFPIVVRTAVLTEPDTATTPPTKPTHVVVAPADVRRSASDDAAVVQRLAPGSQVSLVESAGGWMLVARDGKMLGYVAANALLRLQ